MDSGTLKNLPILQFELLKEHANLYHFVTTRISGLHEGAESFNLGVLGDADPVSGRKNRSILSQCISISQDHLLFMKQGHGTEIRIIDPAFFKHEENLKASLLENIDAMITDQAGTCLCALGADCGTILLFDPTTRVIACIHAGWRGTVKNLPGKVVNQMQQLYNADPQNIIAGIGPCISGRNYEVGEEVSMQFEAIFGQDEHIITHPKNKAKPHVDIAAANARLLKESGLLPTHIQQSGICTFDSRELFFSARRGDTGRFCSGIMLTNK